LTNKLHAHYFPLHCLRNVHHVAQYTTLTCSQSSFLEPLTFCCIRILSIALRELN
jgi:hypothetical protein